RSLQAPAWRESRARNAGWQSRAECSTVSAARAAPRAPYPIDSGYRFNLGVQFVCVAGPGEFRSRLASLSANTCGRVKQGAETKRNLAHIVGILDTKPAHRGRHQLRNARERAGHHGQSTGHRFHYDVAERFEQRRHRKRVRRVKDRLYVGLWTREDYSRADVEGASAAREFVGRSIGADHQQERAARDQRPCFDEESQSLAGEAIANKDDHAGTGRNCKLLADSRALGRIGGGPEAIEIDAIIDRNRFFRREAEFPNQIVANEIR